IRRGTRFLEFFKRKPIIAALRVGLWTGSNMRLDGSNMRLDGSNMRLDGFGEDELFCI
ncbi:hypothetical protein KUCAC02_031786, partial [Chaenocephalus aceratus]